MTEEFKKKLREKGEVFLKVKIRPASPQTAFKNIMADKTIKIDIKERPIEGKANAELIKFLANEFAISEKNVKIVSGASDKLKLVRIIKN